MLNNRTFKVYDAGEDYIVVRAEINHSVPYAGNVTVTRVAPELDGGLIVEYGNRLWGCNSETNEIYCCKLGDETNWQAYSDGISTDSWYTVVGKEEIVAGAEALLSGNLESYESVVNKYVGLNFDEDIVVGAINSVVDNFEKEKNHQSENDNENESENEEYGTMYNYNNLFEALKNGDNENYDRIYEYLITKGGKESKDIKSAMRNASRTDKMFAELIKATSEGDKDTVTKLQEELRRIYGSDFSIAFSRYQKRQREKEQQKQSR